MEATAAAKLANIGLTKDSLSIMQSKLECSDRIIETISNAMAYFQLKADSYIDCVCSHVLLYLLRDFAHDLGSELNKGIGVFTKSEDDLYRLFSEGDDVGRQREEIQRRGERQKEALKLINDHLGFK